MKYGANSFISFHFHPYLAVFWGDWLTLSPQGFPALWLPVGFGHDEVQEEIGKMESEIWGSILLTPSPVLGTPPQQRSSFRFRSPVGHEFPFF